MRSRARPLSPVGAQRLIWQQCTSGWTPSVTGRQQRDCQSTTGNSDARTTRMPPLGGSPGMLSTEKPFSHTGLRRRCGTMTLTSGSSTGSIILGTTPFSLPLDESRSAQPRRQAGPDWDWLRALPGRPSFLRHCHARQEEAGPQTQSSAPKSPGSSRASYSCRTPPPVCLKARLPMRLPPRV